jgi:hypothetical protein
VLLHRLCQFGPGSHMTVKPPDYVFVEDDKLTGRIDVSPVACGLQLKKAAAFFATERR